MRKIDETLLQRASTAISKEIIKALEPNYIARYLVSVNPYLKDNGKNAYQYAHVSDMSGAFVQYRIPTNGGHKDSVTSSQTIVEIPYLYKTFEMAQADITAWDSGEFATTQDNTLSAISATTAARKVQQEEEELILNGWKGDDTNYKIKGFSAAAKNIITGGSIATAGTLSDYVGDAIDALISANVYGENNSYNLTVPTKIGTKLMNLRYTNGDYEIEHLRKILGDGDIYMTPKLNGTALVTPVDTTRQHFELLNPVEFTTSLTKSEYQNDPHLGVVKGTVYELCTPSFLRTDANGLTEAVSKITGLTTE